MGRGGKVGSKRSRRRIPCKDQGSDDSDEDFTVGEDEGYEDSDEYCSSLDADESEEDLGEFELEEEREEEEEENVPTKVKKAARSKAQKSVSVKKAKGVKKLHKKKKKKRSTYKQEGNDYYSEDDDDMEFTLDGIEFVDDEDETPLLKKKRVSYRQEDDDDDYDDGDEEEDDEEFTLDGIDFVDDEDDMPVAKKNKKVGARPHLRNTGLAKGQQRKRNYEVLKNPTRKKPRTNRRLVRKSSFGNVAICRLDIEAGSDGEFADKSLVVEKRSKKHIGRRRRRFMAVSDSDFMSSGSSDYEFTISEEEREQVREANKFCTTLTTNLRSSSSSKKINEESVCKQRKHPGRKGKEKVDDLNNKVGKQVCGICLSEEGKKTVRGTLNCCSHYFCFACIMEWSKVESRCPLCKQRFVTISKPSKSHSGFDLRTSVIQVPERDQVYQPSEEELRGYLDPYDGVICTECQQGGDDALMLLCDICDSPAHTYCVGLGREVPEGNWYCEGCRPAACGSLNPQGLNPAPDQRSTNNLVGLSSPVHNAVELDLNSLYVPDTSLAQESGFLSSSRRFDGGFHTAPSPSGSVAFTVSDRRRIQRQIHHLLNSRRNFSTGQSNGIPSTNSGIRLFGSQIDQGTEPAFQQIITPERFVSQYVIPEGRLQNSTATFVQSRDHFSARSSQLRGQGQIPSTSVGGILQAEHAGNNSMALNSRLTYEQLRPRSSRSNVSSDVSPSPYGFSEATIPSRTSQGANLNL